RHRQIGAIHPSRTWVTSAGRRLEAQHQSTAGSPVARQFIGTYANPAARLKSIAEQFPMVPAAMSLHRVGLIRRGCSLRAYRLELGLLLVAQRSIEIVKCRAHQRDCLQHGVEP